MNAMKPDNPANRLHGTHAVYLLFACLASAILLLACPTVAVAADGKHTTVDPIEHGDRCSAVVYDNSNGLPASEANDIVQTSDGFIWIGCYSGLIRYDGNTFERMGQSIGVDSVNCLLVDSRDRLWIGSNDSGLTMIDHETIHHWDEEDGLGSPKVEALAEGNDGTIYVGTADGLAMVLEDLTISTPSDLRVSGAYVDDIVQANDGLVYCLTNEDDYFTMRKGVLMKYVDHEKSTIGGITCIFPDPDVLGSFYVGTEGSNLFHVGQADDPESIETIDISPLFNVMEIEQAGGRIWICARNGIGVLADDGFHYLDDLPLNSSVDNMMEDYEGNLWFTSSRQGVMKIVPNQFTDVFMKYDIPETPVNSTLIYEGMLFVATESGMIAIADDGPVSSLPLSSATTASGEDLGATDLLELTSGARIRSVLTDSEGRLWISMWRSIGLLRYDDGEVVAFTEGDGLPSNHVRAISEAPDGRILVACTGGAAVIEGDRVVATYGKEDGLDNLETLSVCAAPNGDYLLGSNGGGIYVINGDGIRTLGKKDGLTSGVVMRIKYDPSNDVYWLVTSNSIEFMTPDYRATPVSNFPFSNNYDLYENGNGEMWVLNSFGIYVVPTEQLLANGDIDATRYGLANGMPSTPTSNAYSSLTPEGALYISCSSGVAKVNIDSNFWKNSDLKMAVPYIEGDGELYYPDGRGAFTIPSSVRRLTIHPYVFNYSLSDPQITYQLEGFDDDPIAILRSEMAPLVYTNLQGGTYHFVLTLGGQRGSALRIMSVSITKEKALYEQAWFYILLLALISLIVVACVRRYVKRKVRALEEQHRVEAERERIGNELRMATEIQGSMLPHDFPPFPDRKEFDVYAVMDPALEVGGDFYDFFLIDDDHLCLMVADVSGKGIPAALFMMISKVILESFATLGSSAAEILTKANEAICSNNQADMFVTVWLGILEISSGRLVAANAGHEYPVLRRGGGPYELIKDKHGLVIGGMDGVRYKEYDLQLKPGDRVFVYTDGVPEAMDSDGKMFGTGRMVETLNADPDVPLQELLDNVRKGVDGFVKDAVQFDDLTMLCLEYEGHDAS